MIRIAVIDDEKAALSVTAELIKGAVDAKEEVKVAVYEDGRSFLNKTAEGEDIDIVITDIEMEEMDGIQLGKRIRKELPGTHIIFLTSYSKYAVDSYMIEAYQYILKQDMRERLPVIINRLVNKIITERMHYRTIGTGGDWQKVKYSDIIFVSKSKGAKYVRYHTIHGEYTERISLKALLQEMQSREFILVERGYMINMKHISGVSGSTISLTNGYQVVVSRARMSMVKEQIHMFLGDL